MIKSKCTLDVGGPLHATRTEDFLIAIRMKQATFLLRDRSLISVSSISADTLLNYIKDGTFRILFQEEEGGHEMSKYLIDFLNNHKLDYRWSWEGFYNVPPGAICFDATMGQGESFLAIDDQIVLSLSEINDPNRCAAAQFWSSWSPRPLTAYESNHELLAQTARMH